MAKRQISDGNPDGQCLGQSTTDKISFHNATPVDKPASTEDLKDILVAYGLMTTGGATPLNLDGGALTADSATVTSLSVSGLASFASDISLTSSGDLTVDGITATDVTISNDLTIGDAGNVIAAVTTGTKIGTATDQKLGFWNATPVVQPVGASQAAVTQAAGATSASTIIASNQSGIAANKVLVNQLRADLVTLGIIKGAA
jgi:hypothetical protein